MKQDQARRTLSVAAVGGSTSAGFGLKATRGDLRFKSDLRNHQAIRVVQPRLYDCLMVTLLLCSQEQSSTIIKLPRSMLASVINKRRGLRTRSHSSVTRLSPANLNVVHNVRNSCPSRC